MSAAPARDKKQIIVVSVFGVLLLGFVAYAYNSFFGGSPNPAAIFAASFSLLRDAVPRGPVLSGCFA